MTRLCFSGTKENVPAEKGGDVTGERFAGQNRISKDHTRNPKTANPQPVHTVCRWNERSAVCDVLCIAGSNPVRRYREEEKVIGREAMTRLRPALQARQTVISMAGVSLCSNAHQPASGGTHDMQLRCPNEIKPARDQGSCEALREYVLCLWPTPLYGRSLCRN